MGGRSCAKDRTGQSGTSCGAVREVQLGSFNNLPTKIMTKWRPLWENQQSGRQRQWASGKFVEGWKKYLRSFGKWGAKVGCGLGGDNKCSYEGVATRTMVTHPTNNVKGSSSNNVYASVSCMSSHRDCIKRK